MNILDITGTFFAFIATICFIRINVWAWPISLIAIAIDMVLYYQKGIYGDMFLQLLYLAMTIFGWYRWWRKSNDQAKVIISSLAVKSATILGMITFVGIILVVFYLKSYTDSQVPFWDAASTVLSLVAQGLTSFKIIQCWWLWFVVDAIYVGMYFYKDIPAHAVLNIFYLILAVMGYLAWRVRRQRAKNYQ